MNKIYILYDGRAADMNTDEASVQVTATSLEKARDYIGSFGDSVCFSYDNDGEFLEHETWEFSYLGGKLYSADDWRNYAA